MKIKKEHGVIILAVVLILLLASIWGGKENERLVIDLNNPSSTEDTTVKTPSVSNTPKPSPVVNTETFTNIFPQKGNYECQYEEVTQSKRSTNTVYFSDGRMRGEFRTVGSSSNIMVYDGAYLYTWIEGKPTGVVSRPKSVSEFPYIVPRDFTQGKVLSYGSDSVSWQCHAWIKDPKILTKPSYVTFN